MADYPLFQATFGLAEHEERETLGGRFSRPIQRTKTRIKRPESVQDKVLRLREEFPDGLTKESLPTIRDLLGGRAVVFFLSHFALVDQEIRAGGDFELHEKLKPRAFLPRETAERLGLDPDDFDVRGIKPSGYASIHYFLRLSDAPGVPSSPLFELQVRTMVEEVWGEVEHQLGYKRNRGTELSVSRQFRVIANQLRAIDEHFDLIYDRLSFLQSRSAPESGDLLNAENFPRVLARHELVVEQNQIDRLLDILDTYEIRTVADFDRRARAEIVEAIKSEYFRLMKGQASAFHLVSTIAPLRPNATVDDAQRTLRGNLKLVEATERSRAPLEEASDEEEVGQRSEPLRCPRG